MGRAANHASRDAVPDAVRGLTETARRRLRLGAGAGAGGAGAGGVHPTPSLPMLSETLLCAPPPVLRNLKNKPRPSAVARFA